MHFRYLPTPSVDQICRERREWLLARVPEGFIPGLREVGSEAWWCLPILMALEGDGVPFDDERTVIIRGVDEVRVLLVDGDPGTEARESETFFLRHALAPVSDEMRGVYPVKPSIVLASDLANEALGRYHAVVLANVADIPLAFADRLATYVEAGGGLVIFPGGNLRPESYNTLLHSKHALLPISFTESDGTDKEHNDPYSTLYVRFWR